jgi:hypothetical protein
MRIFSFNFGESTHHTTLAGKASADLAAPEINVCRTNDREIPVGRDAEFESSLNADAPGDHWWKLRAGSRSGENRSCRPVRLRRSAFCFRCAPIACHRRIRRDTAGVHNPFRDRGTGHVVLVPRCEFRTRCANTRRNCGSKPSHSITGCCNLVPTSMGLRRYRCRHFRRRWHSAHARGNACAAPATPTPRGILLLYLFIPRAA